MKHFLMVCLLAIVQCVQAQQIKGIVIDEATGDSIPFPTVQYKKINEAVAGNINGRFSIKRHNGA